MDISVSDQYNMRIFSQQTLADPVSLRVCPPGNAQRDEGGAAVLMCLEVVSAGAGRKASVANTHCDVFEHQESAS